MRLPGYPAILNAPVASTPAGPAFAAVLQLLVSSFLPTRPPNAVQRPSDLGPFGACWHAFSALKPFEAFKGEGSKGLRSLQLKSARSSLEFLGAPHSEQFGVVRSCLGARLEAVQKFRFYIKNKIRREAARQYFGSCLEAVRSCLEARLEAVRKFRFYIKNKIRLLGSILAAAWKQFGVAWKRVSSGSEI